MSEISGRYHFIDVSVQVFSTTLLLGNTKRGCPVVVIVGEKRFPLIEIST